MYLPVCRYYFTQLNKLEYSFGAFTNTQPANILGDLMSLMILTPLQCKLPNLKRYIKY